MAITPLGPRLQGAALAVVVIDIRKLNVSGGFSNKNLAFNACADYELGGVKVKW